MISAPPCGGCAGSVEFQGDAAKRDPMSDESLWFRRAFMRMPESPLNGRAGDALHKIWALTSATRDQPPVGLDPPAFPRSEDRSGPGISSRWEIAWRAAPQGWRRRNARFRKLARADPHPNAPLKIEPLDDFWEGGVAPAWADGWGSDEFGPWVDLSVERAKQRLRWIPPGKFWMGSPERRGRTVRRRRAAARGDDRVRLLDV